MNTWILQGNATKFRVAEYVQHTLIVWRILETYECNPVTQMHPGDEVYIWRANEGDPPKGGIIARGIIASRPGHHDDPSAYELWIDLTERDIDPGLTVKIEIDSQGFISRTAMKDNHILKNLPILEFWRKTTYLVSDQEQKLELQRQWNQAKR